MTSYKVGDWVEKKGKKTSLWFDGEIREINNNQVKIVVWGWSPEPEGIDDSSQLRPIVLNNPIIIRKGSSLWAFIDVDGTIHIYGRILGSIHFEDGVIKKNGAIAGQITFGGLLKKDGREVGSIKPTNELYKNGSIIGSINNQDGIIKKNDLVWGSIEGYHHTFRELRYVSAVLAFFEPEFGYE